MTRGQSKRESKVTGVNRNENRKGQESIKTRIRSDRGQSKRESKRLGVNRSENRRIDERESKVTGVNRNENQTRIE